MTSYKRSLCSKEEDLIKEGNETKVYKLKKTLYGLQQALRTWYNRTDGYLQQKWYIRSETSPPCM